MDHLGIDKFMVMGFCIGGLSWSLLKRAPNRVAAAVLAPKYPGTFWKNWGATLIAKRPEITLQDDGPIRDQYA
jgi:pimeloyl-ACP methyl ester carboxylesterase